MNEILENIEEVKQFISVDNNYSFDEIRPYLRKAIRKYIKPFLGNIVKFNIEEHEGEKATEKNEVRCLLQEAIVNFGFYLYMPIGAVHLTTDGIRVSESTDYKSASNAQMNDLKRDFLRSGHEALDELIKVLHNNADLFEDYETSHLQKNKDLIVQTTYDFNQFYYIHESRQTYLALTPFIRRVEDQYIQAFLCDDYLGKLKRDELEDLDKKVFKLLQKAVVAFTVSKVVHEGQFILDGSGIHLKFDTLPFEKVVTNINLKINDFLLRTKEIQETAGFEYLNRIEKLIRDNSESFTDCDGKVLLVEEKEDNNEGSVFEPYDTKSVLGI